jgi:hypothetical protein
VCKTSATSSTPLLIASQKQKPMFYFKSKTEDFNKEKCDTNTLLSRPLLFLIFVLNLSCHFAFGQKENDKPKLSGFLDFNEYYDTRDFSTFTLNIMANFSSRLQYFSLTNYSSNTNAKDLESFYAEHHLRWNVYKKLPLDLTQLWVNQSGPSNDNVKYGIRWRLNQTPKIDSLFKKINLMFFVNFHLVEFAKHRSPTGFTQMEYVYKIDILPSKLNNRLYLSGFADQDLIWDSNAAFKSIWVTEHQLGIRIIGGLHAVAEYRINEYIPDKSGWGLGIQYFSMY